MGLSSDRHPIIIQHPCGVLFNLLGPSNAGSGINILMDVEEKYPGITHVSFKVEFALRWLACFR